jgi:hypothetical protein
MSLGKWIRKGTKRIQIIKVKKVLLTVQMNYRLHIYQIHEYNRKRPQIEIYNSKKE